MKRNFKLYRKRFLSLLLVVCLVLPLAAVPAVAEALWINESVSSEGNVFSSVWMDDFDSVLEFEGAEKRAISDHPLFFSDSAGDEYIDVLNHIPMLQQVNVGDSHELLNLDVSVSGTPPNFELLGYYVLHRGWIINQGHFADASTIFNVIYSIESSHHTDAGDYAIAVHYSVDGIEGLMITDRLAYLVIVESGISPFNDLILEPMSNNALRTVPPLTGNARNNIVAIARSQIGVTELGDTNRNPFSREMRRRDGHEWCGDFAAWVLHRAGFSRYTQHAYAYGPYSNRGWNFSFTRNWWREHNNHGGSPFARVTGTPQAGDIVVWQDHIAILTGVSGSNVSTVGGNESNGVRYTPSTPMTRPQGRGDFLGYLRVRSIADTTIAINSVPEQWYTNQPLTFSWVGGRAGGENFMISMRNLTTNQVVTGHSNVNVGTSRQRTVQLSALTGGHRYRFWVQGMTSEVQHFLEFDLVIPPVVTTAPMSPSTNLPTSVTMRGNIDRNSGSAITEIGVDWAYSAADIGTTRQRTERRAATANSGAFSFNVTGLTPGRTVHYRLWARNGAGFGLGEIRNFSTANEGELPARPVIQTDRAGYAPGNQISFSFAATRATEYEVLLRRRQDDGQWRGWNPNTNQWSGAVGHAWSSGRRTSSSFSFTPNAVGLYGIYVRAFNASPGYSSSGWVPFEVRIAPTPSPLPSPSPSPSREETDPPPRPVVSGTPAADSITVYAITAPAGWTTQYRIQIDDPHVWSTWGEWQYSNTFTDLIADTDYLVQVRFTANNTATHAHSSIRTAEIRTAENIIQTTSPPPQPVVSGTPTTNSITVNAITAPAGWTTQYRIQTGATGTWGEWQNSNTFTGLSVDTDYQVQARFTANNTTTHANSGESPASASIRTARNQVTATWNADGGAVSPATSSLTPGVAFGVLPTPARPGFTFDGWFGTLGDVSVETQITSESIVPDRDIILFARWTPSEPGGAVMYGDVNSDGSVNIADILLLRRHVANHDLAGLGIYFNRAAADVNGDGVVNLADIIHLRRFVARHPGVVLGPQISTASDFGVAGAVMDAYGYEGEYIDEEDYVEISLVAHDVYDTSEPTVLYDEPTAPCEEAEFPTDELFEMIDDIAPELETEIQGNIPD